jgi:hypothetical protein
MGPGCCGKKFSSPGRLTNGFCNAPPGCIAPCKLARAAPRCGAANGKESELKIPMDLKSEIVVLFN